MATKKSKVEELQEEIVLQPEITEETDQVVEEVAAPAIIHGNTSRGYTSNKYKK